MKANAIEIRALFGRLASVAQDAKNFIFDEILQLATQFSRTFIYTVVFDEKLYTSTSKAAGNLSIQ